MHSGYHILAACNLNLFQMSAVEIQHIKSDGHQIILGRHCLAELAELLSTDTFSGVKLFILVDENTLKFCLSTLISRVSALSEAEVIEIGYGEESKSVEVSSQIWSVLSELNADRRSVLINLGGGVITDLGGFIAGTFKRGIRFFNIPTSLLAQVDASVGGKVGINHDGLKNEVGLFINPEAVFIDPEFLGTLPRKHLLSGFSEMIKHGLICDKDYWERLKLVSFYEMESFDEVIVQSVKIKNEIVGSDPHESGRRKILNFGHTIGHAVESYSFESDAKALLHGEAVAMGMVCESFISYKLGMLSEGELQEITAFIFSHFTPVVIEQIVFHRLIELMKHDKKNRDGEIKMSLLQGIGDAVIDKPVKADLIIDSLNFYARWVN